MKRLFCTMLLACAVIGASAVMTAPTVGWAKGSVIISAQQHQHPAPVPTKNK